MASFGAWILGLFVALTLAFFGNPRFVFPAVPILCLYAAAAIRPSRVGHAS